ncbi:MAG: OmpH family outer membrane protein [Deltaproteobacteria bacterium]|nr:OmpH family outer membrane protein [Deltaproteobacteria bacterium]
MQLLLLVISFVISLSGLAYAQSPAKIGYIDLQRVIRESQAGKSARASFEKEFQEKRSIIEQKKQRLDSMKQEFLSQASIKSEQASKDKAEQIERLEKEYNRTRDDFRDELQRRDLELTQKILSELESVIKQIGDSEGYSLIFEKTEAGVVYAGKGVDLTDKLIQAYDSKKGGAKK